MKKVLIDSSNWFSYFINQGKEAHLQSKINDFLGGEYTIFLPEMIYIETRNVLARLGFSSEKVNKSALFFDKNELFNKYHGDETFWFYHVDRVRELVKLRTQDLIILTHAVVLEVDEFYTGDRKLQEAYNIVISHYENLKKKKTDSTRNSSSGIP